MGFKSYSNIFITVLLAKNETSCLFTYNSLVEILFNSQLARLVMMAPQKAPQNL